MANKDSVDPVLTEQIDSAGDNDAIEAMLVVNSNDDADACSSVVEKISVELDESPEALDILPSLGVLKVKSSANFLRRLLDEDSVVAASAADADVFAPDGSIDEQTPLFDEVSASDDGPTATSQAWPA